MYEAIQLSLLYAIHCQDLFYTSIAFTKSLVYALQPFIVDACQIIQMHFSKSTLKSLLVISSKGASGGLHTIPCLKHNKKAIKSEVIHSFVPFNAICYLVIPYAVRQHFTSFHITAQDMLMTCIPLATTMPIAYRAFVLTAYDCTRHLYKQRS